MPAYNVRAASSLPGGASIWIWSIPTIVGVFQAFMLLQLLLTEHQSVIVSSSAARFSARNCIALTLVSVEPMLTAVSHTER